MTQKSCVSLNMHVEQKRASEGVKCADLDRSKHAQSIIRDFALHSSPSENVPSSYADSKGPDQTARKHSLYVNRIIWYYRMFHWGENVRMHFFHLTRSTCQRVFLTDVYLVPPPSPPTPPPPNIIRETPFCDSLFAFLHINPILKRNLLLEECIFSQEEQFYPLRVDPLQKGTLKTEFSPTFVYTR